MRPGSPRCGKARRSPEGNPPLEFPELFGLLAPDFFVGLRRALFVPPPLAGRAIAYDLEFLFCRPSESWGPRPRTAITTQQRVPGPQLSLGRQEKKATNAIAPRCGVVGMMRAARRATALKMFGKRL